MPGACDKGQHLTATGWGCVHIEDSIEHCVAHCVEMIVHAGSNLPKLKGAEKLRLLQEKLSEKTGEEDSSAAEQYRGVCRTLAKGSGNGSSPSPTKLKVLLLPLPCINLLT